MSLKSATFLLCFLNVVWPKPKSYWVCHQDNSNNFKKVQLQNSVNITYSHGTIFKIATTKVQIVLGFELCNFSLIHLTSYPHTGFVVVRNIHTISIGNRMHKSVICRNKLHSHRKIIRSIAKCYLNYCCKFSSM